MNNVCTVTDLVCVTERDVCVLLLWMYLMVLSELPPCSCCHGWCWHCICGSRACLICFSRTAPAGSQDSIWYLVPQVIMKGDGTFIVILIVLWPKIILIIIWYTVFLRILLRTWCKLFIGIIFYRFILLLHWGYVYIQYYHYYNTTLFYIVAKCSHMKKSTINIYFIISDFCEILYISRHYTNHWE